VSHPAVKLGRPVVAGTRITVDEILDALADGTSVAAVAAAHPGLAVEEVRAALRFAADAVRRDTPIEDRPPLELHGAHVVEIPDQNGGPHRPAVAVRTYLPDAAQVSVQRLPPAPRTRSWLPALDSSARPPRESPPFPVVPMERIHPAGVFEAIFPEETVPFPYRLKVKAPRQAARIADDPYGLPPCLTPAELPQFAAPAADARRPAEPDPRSYRQHRQLGARLVRHAGRSGVAFAVWAPNARSVSVVGDFNGWNGQCHPLRPVGASGVWELFVPNLGAGERYKYRIATQHDGRTLDKADPYAFAAEVRPATASIIWDLNRYRWNDAAWLRTRPRRQAPDAPISIYEVHLGSWRRAAGPDGQARWLTYRELADQLVPYVKDLGYTHIEPMPVAEHPFDGSWGYQVTGFFAATSRYGSPDDFRYFVDRAHQAGLGVILDWVPGHFPKDAHGLAQFDGTPLYEHPDPRRSENLEWGTSSFNLDRPEIAAFLLSNALFWIEEYHVDGLRVDAVSSMIYLDYSRQHWVPNALGGRENLEAAAFLQQLNRLVHQEHPGVLMIAEESTAWPRVTGRDHPDCLGFDLKWNLGWMHDTLGYAGRDPLFRRHHHNDLTFSLVYAFKERFLLPFSHDEVVHGKRSLAGKMPGEPAQRFANLRAVYGYLFAHPGKKLLFMGSEFGPELEWNEDAQLDWTLLERAPHRQLRDFVRALNRIYADHPALHERDFGWEGFQWIDCEDADRSIVSFLRRGADPDRPLVIVINFTPVPRPNYRLGVPAAGSYREVLNSDAVEFGGGGCRNRGRLRTEAEPVHGQPHALTLTLPPLAVLFIDPAVGPPAS
jgi:1,4-alpha-glucan branching enzyme